MAVPGGHRLALLGDPDAAVDRPARLGANRLVGPAAAARRGAAAAVEELERQPVLARLPGQALLRDVQGPLAREEPRVLARVRVAEHDRLAVAVAAQRVAVRRGGGEGGHPVAGAPPGG